MYQWRFKLEGLAGGGRSHPAMRHIPVMPGRQCFCAVRSPPMCWLSTSDITLEEVTIDPAGHWLHIDQPETFNRRVCAFCLVPNCDQPGGFIPFGLGARVMGRRTALLGHQSSKVSTDSVDNSWDNLRASGSPTPAI